MNRVLLVISLFAIAACATSDPKPERSATEPVSNAPPAAGTFQETESKEEELQARNDSAQDFAGIDDIDVPEAREVPTEMMPHVREAEPDIFCTRTVPTGSVLPVKVCRTRAEMARDEQEGQDAFNDIKHRTAIGSTRMGTTQNN